MGNSQQVTAPNSASKDIASRALAAAHRVDEAKQLYSKAEAVWIYAQQSGDYELQNKAAEIRLFAQRRAGELMAQMAMHLDSRGQGRPRRDGAEIGRSNSAIGYCTKPEETGVIKGKSSKWQRVARWIGALSSKTRIGGNVVPGAPLFFPSHPVKASLNQLRVASGQHARFFPVGSLLRN